MSLHRELFKSQQQASISNSSSTSALALPTVNSLDDFTSALSARLSALNLSDISTNAAGSSSTSDPPSRSASRSGSVRGLLSRQDSRTNSLLTQLIDPEDKSTAATVSAPIDKLYGIPDLLRVLAMSSRSATRSGIGRNEREILFAHLYRMIISPASDIYMGSIGPNDEDYNTLVSIKSTLETRFEWEAWLRCVVSYGCVGVDEVASDVVESVFPVLLGEINTGTERKESSIWAFMACLLFIYHGSENYGMLDHAKVFLQLVESNANDGGVVAACLNMVALTLTLAWESGRDVRAFIEDEVLDVVKVSLDNKGKVRSGGKAAVIAANTAAAVLAGVCYEVSGVNRASCDQSEDINDEDLDNYDYDYLLESFDEIAGILEPLANEGAKKAGKKGKVAKNIFRDVANTLTHLKSGELDSILITKSKSIRVSTWFAYVRVQILRFTFANELSAWMAKVKDIRGMLKMYVKVGDGATGDGADDDDDEDYEWDSDVVGRQGSGSGLGEFKGRKFLEKERSLKLKKDRLEKQLQD